jgi:hypothetical protein
MGGTMYIDRAQADRAFAYLGFTLSFLFILAVVALAFGTTTNNPPSSPAAGAHGNSSAHWRSDN